jgi:hypothetical protein
VLDSFFASSWLAVATICLAVFCAALAAVAIGVAVAAMREGRKLHDTRRRDAVSGAAADNDGQ